MQHSTLKAYTRTAPDPERPNAHTRSRKCNAALSNCQSIHTNRHRPRQTRMYTPGQENTVQYSQRIHTDLDPDRPKCTHQGKKHSTVLSKHTHKQTYIKTYLSAHTLRFRQKDRQGSRHTLRYRQNDRQACRQTYT